MKIVLGVVSLSAYTAAETATRAELLLQQHSTLSVPEQPRHNSTSSSPQHDSLAQCRTFLARSTIPGAGLGLFAGVPFAEGDEVTPGDAVIPLRDIDWNNDYKDVDTFMWDDYIWNGGTFPNMKEPNHDIDGASFGIGALPNCFFALLNVEDGDGVLNDHANVDRRSPGMGAFTPFHDRRSHATKDIQAGEELFVDYGYDYFKGSRADTIGLIPFLDSYEHADRLLDRFSGIVKRIGNYRERSCQKNQQCEGASPDLASDLFDTARNIISKWPSRTFMALPDDFDSVDDIRSKGGTTMKDYERSIRDIQGIRENGLCTDHLRVQNSEIPDAGRGAFAVRDLQEGDVVAPVPLIHLPERSVLDIYEEGLIKDDYQNERGDTVVHQQLLLNYCFGHRNTTLLLCPYGVTSTMVNHAPTFADDGGPTANVRIQWSSVGTTHPEWMDQPVNSWGYDYRSGLAFEYVALRDIQQGEEVLVDYGDEWATAWADHVTSWEPIRRRVDILNEDIDSQVPTYNEWKYSMGDPSEDSDAVNLWCYSIYREFQGLPYAPDVSYPCKAILRNPDNTYTVELVYQHQYESDTEGDGFCKEEFDEVVWAVPRDMLGFGGLYEQHDERDYKNRKSFRHDLHIPDHLLPVAWKNA